MSAAEIKATKEAVAAILADWPGPFISPRDLTEEANRRTGLAFAPLTCAKYAKALGWTKANDGRYARPIGK
jgi:hypothetical protein